MRRWLAGTAIVVTAVGVFLLTREDDSPAATNPTAEVAPVRARSTPQVRRAPAPVRGEPERHYIEKQYDPTPTIKKWKVDGLPGTFREMANADAPEFDKRVDEQLTYKKRRLRFRLTDVAATCYDGGDGKEQISFGYTMVVQSGQMWLEDVRVLHSNLSDRALEQCIVDAVRGLRTTAQDIPDLRKDQQTAISQHDLWSRNRGA